jgi:anaerobic dimethyl sulfoxide reductase subunit A
MSEGEFASQPLGMMDRRSFLKWSAVLGGTAAVAVNGGLGLTALSAQAGSIVAAPNDGVWKTAICWHNCGGRCLIQVQVVDKTVVRVKTDDTHPDSPDYPQQRGCARGRSQRMQVFSADRLKYPMKRKNWAPGGGNKELRGKDEWVRISWDEALDIVTSEIKRVKEKYGNQAILAFDQAGGQGGVAQGPLSLYGGFVTAWGSTSFGTWADTGPKIGVFTPMPKIGLTNQERADQNDRFDVRNSQLIVIWGANASWSGAGNPTYYYMAAKRAGAKIIYVDPLYTETAKVLADEWIPIRPGTDHAMALGMMHTLITEDDPAKNPLIDWDFLNRCTVGFDKDHMPKDADPKENFRDYVLGTYDGQPKTPEWASEISGVSPDKIRSFAREVAMTKKTALHAGYAPSRTNNQDSWPQAFMTLGWMCGHVGQSGRMTGTSCRYNAGGGGPELIHTGASGMPSNKNPIANIQLNNSEVWDAVLTGKYTNGYKDVKDINIQLIYHGGTSALNQKVGIVKGIQAHRKVEFVVSQHYFLNTSAKYSDVVLPVTTRWERWADFGDGNDRKREFTVVGSQIADPMYEAKDDVWIASEIGKRLGLDNKLIMPFSTKQKTFNEIANSTVIKEDGSGYEPLVTITAQDLTDIGVEGKPQTGRLPVKEFIQKGTYQVKRFQGDKYGYIAFKAYRENPEANKLATASGKFEIHSKALADFVKSKGWTEIAPIPAYQRPIEGYEDTFSDWKNKVKGPYPLQLFTIHYPRRAHSNYDNVTWLREAFPQEFMMNPLDAEPRGIKSGDYVKVSSKHGAVIRPVYVTPRIMPGVTTLGQGAWAEIDEATGLDKAGNTNMLNGPIATGQGHAGYNTCIVQVEKWQGTLLADYKWPQRILFEKGA